MLFTYMLFQTAYALDENIDKYKHKRRIEFGLCAGISVECMLPAIKAGFVHKSIGIGLSVSPLGFSSSLSVRIYHNSNSPIRPYAYAGLMLAVGMGGGGSSAGVGIGTDIHAGPFVLQPSIGFVGSSMGGSIGLLVKI